MLHFLDYKNPIRWDNYINVWPHQVETKSKIINSMIANKLGYAVKVFARKLQAKVIDARTSRLFLEENHLDGSSAASLHYGLFDQDRLMAVMTIGKSRFSKTHDFEIIRLASLCGFVIVGGASKLLKFASQDLHGKLLTYSDRMIGNGNVYKQIGFTHLGVTRPGYFWFKDGQILSRHQTQKHKLEAIFGPVDLSLTENEIMHSNGWTRISDFGHDRWELQINSYSALFISKPNKTWWIDENGIQRRGEPKGNASIGRTSKTTKDRKWVVRDGVRKLVKEVLPTDEVAFNLEKTNKGKKLVTINGKKTFVDKVPENASISNPGTTTGRIGMKSPEGKKKLVTLEEARSLAKEGWVIAAKVIRHCPQHVKDFAKELEKEKGSN